MASTGDGSREQASLLQVFYCKAGDENKGLVMGGGGREEKVCDS